MRVSISNQIHACAVVLNGYSSWLLSEYLIKEAW